VQASLVATLDDTAWGAASDVVPKFVSPSDPAAQWTGAHKGPAFFAYSDNYLIDVKFGVIVDVEASRSIGGIEEPFNQRGRLEIRFGGACSTAPRLSSSVRTSMNAVTTRDSGRCAR
jgi:hypothetical protein